MAALVFTLNAANTHTKRNETKNPTKWNKYICAVVRLTVQTDSTRYLSISIILLSITTILLKKKANSYCSMQLAETTGIKETKCGLLAILFWVCWIFGKIIHQVWKLSPTVLTISVVFIQESYIGLDLLLIHHFPNVASLRKKPILSSTF